MSADPLSPEDGRRLLDLVRQTVGAYVTGQSLPAPLPCHAPPFNREVGLFVTLHVDGRLRGCMGTFHPHAPLGRLAQEITLNSLNDPRFPTQRLRPAELPRLTLDVSVLSPMVRSHDPLAEMATGVHGVLIRLGGRGGCFLPQVATEMNWSTREMLDHCCDHKAGLPADAWRLPQAEVYLFTAQVLEERV